MTGNLIRPLFVILSTALKVRGVPSSEMRLLCACFSFSVYCVSNVFTNCPLYVSHSPVMLLVELVVGLNWPAAVVSGVSTTSSTNSVGFVMIEVGLNKPLCVPGEVMLLSINTSKTSGMTVPASLIAPVDQSLISCHLKAFVLGLTMSHTE